MTPVLEARFAHDLPELARPWQAEAPLVPGLVVLNEPLAIELGLDVDWLRSPSGTAFLLGTELPDEARPVAQAYAGHQFGGYSPRLGDGRALLLGELVDASGTRRDLHLKGSGRTPFARGGDGRAVLAPMLREHVISEAMHALGIPTTRSLAVLTTGRDVLREDGALPGAVLVRVASSHLRVGTFQLTRTLDDPDLLRRLADVAIARHHPTAAASDTPYLALLEAVRDVQARLVAAWMGVGFVHGVMNTDNVTISGETIDYGPCAFLDAADPATVFSSIDHGGRYAFGNQPAVTGWNLARLAEALLPLLAGDSGDTDEAVSVATASLQRFGEVYAAERAAVLRRKLGLADSTAPGDDAVVALGDELEAMMRAVPVDHTGFWRDLGRAARGDGTGVRDRVLDRPGLDAWLERWRALRPDGAAMDRVNPAHVPRNHLVEEALDAATAGDLGPCERLLRAVTTPYDQAGIDDRYREPAPDGATPYVTYCGT